MHPLVPDFILKKFDDGCCEGQFGAVCLFVDISGFTPLTNVWRAQGTEGTEGIADVLREVFRPLVRLVYEQGGFIAAFAGDAFKAVFPMNDSAYVRAAVVAWQIGEHMVERPFLATPFGTFEFAVKVIVDAGRVEWGIWQAEVTLAAQNALYYFEGEALARCLVADPLAGAGDVIVSQRVYEKLPAECVTAVPVQTHYRLLAVSQSLITTCPPLPMVAEARQVNKSALFFPSELLALPTRGEFRQVVTLFVNLKHLPDDAAFPQRFFRLLDEYGGYLCRWGRIGAKDEGATLLLFWGAPHGHENDLVRALGFVLDLQTAAAVPFKAGITYNLAYAGFIGSELRQEYTCYGGYVNLAARQMVMAGWGEIWLDEAAAAKAQPYFDIQERGLYPFKGFATRRLVYQLQGRLARSQQRFYHGRLVGRDKEMAQLETAVQPLFDGRFAGLVLVTGEAGLGKSRLVHEFLDRQAADFSLFLCQTDEILRQSLNPFRYWLRRYFKQTTDEVENKMNFRHVLNSLEAETADASLKGELQRTRSFLAALVDLYWPDSLYAQLEPELRFANTLVALKTLIQAESLRRPVVLCIEDIHWLDEDSRTFLPLLLADAAQFPLVVIATSRPMTGGEIASLIPPDTKQSAIYLQNLAVSDIAALAEAHLARPVLPELALLLADRCEGNPLFAEQILFYLQERHWLRQDVAGWTIAPAAQGETAVPADVFSLLVSRLDRLPQVVKQMVQMAAVLGREFSWQVLHQMVGEDINVVDRVQTAVDAAIWVTLDDGRYFFKHALLRDAAYTMQGHSQRRHLHQMAADSIQTIYAADLQPHYADLAHHYEQAGIAVQAIYYLTQAGQLASQAYENRQAIDYYSRALVLLPVDEWDGRYELLLAREGIYALLGDREREQQDLLALEQIAQERTNVKYQAQAALRQSHHAFYTSDYEAAEAAAEMALRLAEMTDDSHLLVEASIQFGQSLWSHGQYEMATHHLRRALQQAEDIAHKRAEALALRLLGNVAGVQGRYVEANQYFEQSRRLSHDLSYRQNEVECLNGLGVVAYFQGDFALSSQYHQQGLLARREIGDRVGEAKTLGNLADSLFRQGITADVQSYYQQSLTIRQQVDDKLGVAWVLDKLGELFWFQGDVIQARQYYEQALQIRREVGNLRDSEWSLNNVAAIYRAQGHYHQAQIYHQQALALSLSLGDRDGEAYTRHYLGVLAHVMGDFEAAHHHYGMALTIHRELNNRSGETLTLNYLALLYNHEGEDEQSLVYSQKGLAIAQTINYLDYTAMSWLFMGHAYIRLARSAEAKAAYEQAWQIRQALQQPILALEAQAGLIECMLVGGQTVPTQSELLNCLAFFNEHNVALLYDMPRLFYTYYRVLQTGGDVVQAQSVLATVYRLLNQRADVLSADAQALFWKNNPWHRVVRLVALANDTRPDMKVVTFGA